MTEKERRETVDFPRLLRKSSTRRVRPATSASRTVVIGDLNGADDALWEILRGTRLIDAQGRWTGGGSELVQVGDLFNRGGGARDALTLLHALKRPAQQAGGRVTVLLGNHEVMTALGNEAYCTPKPRGSKAVRKAKFSPFTKTAWCSSTSAWPTERTPRARH